MPLQVGPVTSAGAKLYVVAAGALPATFDEAGYEALTYVECGYITNIPEFGETYNINTLNILGSRVVVKTKGSVDPGSIGVEMARVPGDAGQAILNTARSDDKSYTFKVTINDDFTAGTGHPTTAYFTGKVSGYPFNIGTSDNTVMSTVTIAIDRIPVISVAE